MSEKKETELQKDLKLRLKVYHKLASMYHWSWQEFEDTPWWVCTGLCRYLDELAGDMDKFIGWEEYMEFKNLKRLHGTSDKPTSEPDSAY